MSVPWELITVITWGLGTSAGTFRQEIVSTVHKHHMNMQGSFRCEKKRCNAGEILDDEGYCIRLECGTGFEPGPSGSCIVSVFVKP